MWSSSEWSYNSTHSYLGTIWRLRGQLQVPTALTPWTGPPLPESEAASDQTWPVQFEHLVLLSGVGQDLECCRFEIMTGL